MEEETFKETWEWLDEDFRLDMDSPLAISRSLWDDFIASEGVVRSLFAAPHVECSVSPLSYEKAELFKHGNGWDVVPDCGSSPSKKRRTSKSFTDQDTVYRNICSSGSFENINERNGSCLQQVPVEGPASPNSVWYVGEDESNSSIDDKLHQSTENWMIGSLSDSDTSDGVELPPRLMDAPESTSNSNSSIARPSGLPAKSRQTPRVVPLKVVAGPKTHPIDIKDISENLQIKRGAIHGANLSTIVNENSKPVLAYPFTVVKPCGIQGDVTLQDINKRIKMAPSATSLVVKGSSKSLATPLSGKSVVGLTKIHTEGKGTITILRTRS